MEENICKFYYIDMDLEQRFTNNLRIEKSGVSHEKQREEKGEEQEGRKTA